MKMAHETNANAALKEALTSSKLWSKETGLNGDKYRIGLNFSQVVDPNELYFYLHAYKVHQNLSTFSFFIAGTLAMNYGMNGYPGLNDMVSAGSQVLMMDAYR
mmetsp:Transcript_1371/g.871  ORF Transcript_1371/g.871 Transcript_1371/m.871 type:complete len:103 (-) Transcript_1371:743-1051(-)